MNWKNSIECKIQTPNDASEANDNQGTVDEGAEPNLAQLSRDTAFEYITNWVESRVIWIANKVWREISFWWSMQSSKVESTYIERRSGESCGT